MSVAALLRIITLEVDSLENLGSGVINCRNVHFLLKKNLYPQFRLKKPGGAGVKLFQAILAVNRDPGGTPAAAAPVVDKGMGMEYYIKNE